MRERETQLGDKGKQNQTQDRHCQSKRGNRKGPERHGTRETSEQKEVKDTKQKPTPKKKKIFTRINLKHKMIIIKTKTQTQGRGITSGVTNTPQSFSFISSSPLWISTVKSAEVLNIFNFFKIQDVGLCF